jgi:uncharacterized protein (TIGR02145 family)
MKKSKELLVLVCLILGIVIIDSCKKDVSLPVLTTTNPTNITINSVTSGGSITSSGGADVTARGVCYGTSTNPTISGTHTSDNKGSGTFTSSITGLTPDTKYYIRAFATNSAGTAYGNEVSFTTTALVAPTVTTAEVTNITLTGAESGGTITTDGGAPITAKGVCWSATANPTTADSKTSDGTGSTAFTSTLSELTPGTTYYVRAYATNSVGTSYGNERTFATTALAVPTVTTVAVATNVTQTTATSGGEVTSSGGADVTARGVCWSTTANPTTADAKTSDATGIGSFTSSLTNLLPGTTYHVRAYAINSVGTAYGADVTFPTVPVGLATLTTKTVTAISYTTATSGGDITDAGGGSIIEKGVCWGTAALPTVSGSHTTDGAGTASFNSNMASLLSGTMYHVRAYATNSAGTAYGNEQTFTTLTIALATVTTTDPSLVTATTARSGGNITAAGGGTISERGVCWSTSANPTTADPKTSNGTGTGTFVSDLASLVTGTEYHVRAYAVNEAGTAYGEDKTFTTITVAMPVVTTAAITAVAATTATSGGNVTDDGNGTITARGVCWATTTGPLATGSHTTDGTGLGAFVSSITGLTPNTVYYVRAYATNSAGTSYGTDEFTLTTFAATDADGNNYTDTIIGTQTWLLQNLKTTRYTNGELIGTTTPSTLDITAEVSPKYEWAVGNNPANIPVYGRYYTWFAVTDPRGVCPTGWHVPSDTEWETMKTFLGGEAVAGGKIKEEGVIHWNAPNTGATNETHFTALASGYRNYNGSFVSFGATASYWSSTENPINTAWGWGQGLRWDNALLTRGGFDKPDGCVVRCLMNP